MDHTELTDGVTGAAHPKPPKPARRKIKPATLLAHIFDHMEDADLLPESTVGALIQSIERNIIADAVGKVAT